MASPRRTTGSIASQPGRSATIVRHPSNMPANSPVENTPLVEFLNLHLREIAEGLAARGAIPRVPERLPHLQPPRREDLGTRLAALWRRKGALGPF